MASTKKTQATENIVKCSHSSKVLKLDTVFLQDLEREVLLRLQDGFVRLLQTVFRRRQGSLPAQGSLLEATLPQSDLEEPGTVPGQLRRLSGGPQASSIKTRMYFTDSQ